MKEQKERAQQNKKNMIDQMSVEDVLIELKNKKLPTFGTNQEKKDRLKKAHGIDSHTSDTNVKKCFTLNKIEEMNKKREERRKKMEECKKQKLEKEAINEANGINVDVDFEDMVAKYNSTMKPPEQHSMSDKSKIMVCVRKRPIFQKELNSGELDCVSCSNPTVTIHECKLKVDGITKFLDNHEYSFDNVFNEQESSEEFYNYSLKQLIPSLLNQNTVTCFAYGQTGSGKTYTMVDIQRLAISDLFSLAAKKFPKGTVKFGISYFEIYLDKVLDLLNNKNVCNPLEDKNHCIQLQGISESLVGSTEEMIKVMDYANHERKTCATSSNDTSSRSHAICHINIYNNQQQIGKLSIVDLAGSERAYDCQSNEKQRQMEGAEINKSLLALKECIRAINDKATHIPFRTSKLTLVLRDSFIGLSEKIKIVMIACISPGNSAADHTMNTLKYADRLNEKGETVLSNKVNMPEKSNKAECCGKNEPIKKEKEEIRGKENSVMSESSLQDIERMVDVNEMPNEELSKLQELINKQGGDFITFHSKCVKEEAGLLEEETNMITSVNSDKFDFSNYLESMTAITAKRKSANSELEMKLAEMRMLVKQEEEMRQHIYN